MGKLADWQQDMVDRNECPSDYGLALYANEDGTYTCASYNSWFFTNPPRSAERERASFTKAGPAEAVYALLQSGDYDDFVNPDGSPNNGYSSMNGSDNLLLGDAFSHWRDGKSLGYAKQSALCFQLLRQADGLKGGAEKEKIVADYEDAIHLCLEMEKVEPSATVRQSPSHCAFFTIKGPSQKPTPKHSNA